MRWFAEHGLRTKLLTRKKRKLANLFEEAFKPEIIDWVSPEKQKRVSTFAETLDFNVSGWQDSNLRPPAPKAGALTGLRYTPNFQICFKRI
jgi:hypothetical protein